MTALNPVDIARGIIGGDPAESLTDPRQGFVDIDFGSPSTAPSTQPGSENGFQLPDLPELPTPELPGGLGIIASIIAVLVAAVALGQLFTFEVGS